MVKQTNKTLHVDFEDLLRYLYSLEWMGEVRAGFVRDTCGPRPLVAGHELGAELLLRATARGQLTPAKLVLMPFALHRAEPPRRLWRAASRTCAVP